MTKKPRADSRSRPRLRRRSVLARPPRSPARTRSSRQRDVAIDPDDIGGVVTGPKGPEAGVWVIAETRDLPVRYIKSVVTDDRGRFVVPDLPAANYRCGRAATGWSTAPRPRPSRASAWRSRPCCAPDDAAAARYYPAIYWYSMLKIPAADQFGGKSSIPARLTQTAVDRGDEEHRLHRLPSARTGVHAHDPAGARHVRHRRRRLEAARAVGPVGRDDVRAAERPRRAVVRQLRRLDRPHRQGRAAVRQAAAAAGRRAQHRRHAARLDERQALPARPHRQRSPQSDGQRLRPALRVARVQLRRHADPRSGEEHRRRRSRRRCAIRRCRSTSAPATPRRSTPLQPSPYWGSERIWETRVNNHNSMFGRDGRLWLAASVRGADNPAFCKAGLGSSVGEGVPDGARRPPPRGARSRRRRSTRSSTPASRTHHPQFGYDANDTLWTSGGGPVVGWLNTKMFDQTGDAAKSQGWTALVLDTNGNGKRDAYVEPDQPVDPAKDKRVELAASTP